MPDGIAAFQVDGKTYLVTANEGDAREWGDEDLGTFYLSEDEQDFGEETADIVVRQRRQRLAETITELEAATEAARTAMTQRKTVAVPNDEVDEIIDELRAEYKDESGKDGAKGASEDKA